MFFILRKVCIGLALLLVALGGYFLYLKREIFQPALALVEVWRNENVNRQRITGTVTGKVTRVQSGNSLWIKIANGQQILLQLTGLDMPPPPPKPEPDLKELLEQGQELLTKLTLSNEVSVQITYTNNQANSAGVVYAGTNNVNVAILEAGLAKLRKPAIAGLPRQEQYQMIQAQYAARKKQKGWWGSAYANSF